MAEWSEDELEALLTDVARYGWAVMRNLAVRHSADVLVSAIRGLPRSEFQHLRAVHYLMSQSVETFLGQTVPSFLRSMPQSTNLALREDRGLPRGRIDWIRTTASRTRRGLDKSLFVSRVPQRSRNTLAARLFCHLLSDMAGDADQVLSRTIPKVVRDRIGGVRIAARAFLGSLAAKGVEFHSTARADEFNRLRRIGDVSIDAAIALLLFRRRLLSPHGEDELSELLRSTLLVPEDVDTLFEVWALFQILKRHVDTGWSIAESRIIGLGSQNYPQFKLTRSDERVSIYFQHTPPELSAVSCYKDLFAEYDLDVSVRRPDIVILVEATDFTGPLLVEVKRSSNRAYIADGAYKVLGYISDFKDAFPDNKPKAVLVVYSGTAGLEHYPSDSDVWIVPKSRLPSLTLPY